MWSAFLALFSSSLPVGTFSFERLLEARRAGMGSEVDFINLL